MSGADPSGGATTRRALFRRAPLLAAAALAGAGPGSAARAAQRTDADRLARLLRLELRLEAAYEAALAREAIAPRLGELLLAHERDHVRGLEQSLRARGGRPPRDEPRRPPRAALAGRASFARFALDLEAAAVAAHEEALATLRDRRLMLPLGSIMAAGAQHGVALRRSIGADLLRR